MGHVQPEKRLDFSTDIVLGGEKKNIAHGALFIQDDLIKSDYGADKKNFEYFLVSFELCFTDSFFNTSHLDREITFNFHLNFRWFFNSEPIFTIVKFVFWFKYYYSML